MLGCDVRRQTIFQQGGHVTGLSALVVPILLSSVIVFVVSAVIHMAPLWHKHDFPRMPDEDKLLDAVRPLGIGPGDYMVPRPLPGQMRSPEFIEKIKKGPVMLVTVRPNEVPSMSRSLVLWFLYSVAVGFFAAYVTGRALPPGTDYLRVFQLIGATAFIGYSMALWQMSIWYSRAWSMTIKATVDGLIYALLTAGTFGWLWPR
jgi:hypothetical protein